VQEKVHGCASTSNFVSVLLGGSTPKIENMVKCGVSAPRVRHNDPIKVK